MPLSDHEQRLLEQIERALYADDPKFASAVQRTDLRSHYRRRVARSIGGLVIGMLVMLGCVVAQHPYLAVVGFVIMLVAGLRGLSAFKRLSGRAPVTGPAPPAAKNAKAPRRSGLRERAEERWRRRWEDGSGR